jgi:NTE family protein
MAGTAIVLSGGGAKGDFEVGAVRALYDRGIVPNILVGTSVGAINATKLAEGEDPADPSRGLAGLEGIWASLRVDEDMSVPAAWLKDPNLDPELAAALMGTGDVGAIGASAPGPTSGPNVLGAVWLLTDGRRLLESLKVVASSSCLFTLEPIRQKAFSSLDLGKVAQWSARGGRLRLATVSMDTGALRYVTETGALVERDQTTPVADLTHIPAGCQTLIDALGQFRAMGG